MTQDPAKLNQEINAAYDVTKLNALVLNANEIAQNIPIFGEKMQALSNENIKLKEENEKLKKIISKIGEISKLTHA